MKNSQPNMKTHAKNFIRKNSRRIRQIGLLLLGCTFAVRGDAANVEQLKWRFSNPGPHGNNVVNMDWSSSLGLGIQVCERGRFYHSTNLVDWSLGESGTTKSLRGVTFFNDRIVITGEAGTVLWGDSVDHLQPGTIDATDDWLEDVAASTNLVVAVGDFGAIYTSADGVSWTKRSFAHSDWFRAVTWSGPLWVAVGETGMIATSADAITWTKQDSTTTADLNNVAYLDGTYYVVGANGVSLSSPDAVTWTQETTGATNHLFSIATAGGSTRLYAGEDAVWLKSGQQWQNLVGTAGGPPEWTYYSSIGFLDSFVLAGRTGMQVDGVRTNTGPFSWEVTHETTRQWLWDSVYNEGIYVAVGDFGTILTSGNGVAFDLEVVPNAATNTTLLGVAGDTNLLVTVGDSGTILRSTNTLVEVVSTNSSGVAETNLVSQLGLAWETANSPTSDTLQAIAHFEGQFYIGGNNGFVARSSDGQSWSSLTPFASETLTSMAATSGDNARLLAVGDNGTAYMSADGVSFFAAAVPATTNWLYRVRYVNGHFVIVGENGTLITSSDNGQTWVARTSNTSAWLNDVIHVGDTWYAVGTQGTLLSSTNLSDWSAEEMVTGKSLYSLAANGGQMLTFGVEGLILRTRPVTNTNVVEFASFTQDTDTNNVLQNIILFAGEADQTFEFEETSDLSGTPGWTSLGQFEITDPDGFFVHVQSVATNSVPDRRFYRTALTP